MQLILGLTLIFAAIPYATYALMNGVRNPSMGILALVVSGGIMVARAIRHRREVRPPRPVIVPSPLEPAIPAAPRLPSIPPTPPDDDTKAAPPLPAETQPRRERETILPPKKAEEVLAERGHLRLVHSDGRPCDVRAPGRKKAVR